MTQTTGSAETRDAAASSNSKAETRPAPKASTRLLQYVFFSVVAVAVVVLVWEQFFKYRFVAKRWGTVVPGKIYRSGQVSKWMLEKKLNEHHIQVIVDMNGVDPADVHQQSEIAAARRLGIELHRFKLRGDGTGKLENYANAIEVLVECERSGRPVLVHCAAGAQRTGGVVAAYRVLVRGESPKAAYAELGRYGWDADSDQILLKYLNARMEQLALLLVDRGVINQVPRPLPIIGP